MERRHKVRSSWDEGWVGRDVHRMGRDNPARDRTITIQEGDDETLLFVEMNGEKFQVRRKGKAGF